MSAPYFPHHEQNGCPVLRPLTTRPRIDRITTPAIRTKYKGEGICLGAEVSFRYQTQTMTGQVWCASTRGGKFWWIATGTRYIEVHISDLLVIGQALVEQGELEVAS